MANEFSFDVKIKYVTSSRSIRLRVQPNGDVVVTCPPHTPSRFITNFVAKNLDWIEQKRRPILTKLSGLTEQPKTLLFRGKEYDFKLQISSTANPRVELTATEIIVIARSEHHEAVRMLLEKWYRDRAAQYFQQRVPLLADVVNKGVIKVSIRDQNTRWGSCSSRSTISLNWRLIMAPDSVSDYVIYHELAHLTHMNHSAKFWHLVADYSPTYKESEQWLKKHHQLLRF